MESCCRYIPACLVIWVKVGSLQSLFEVIFVTSSNDFLFSIKIMLGRSQSIVACRTSITDSIKTKIASLWSDTQHTNDITEKFATKGYIDANFTFRYLHWSEETLTQISWKFPALTIRYAHCTCQWARVVFHYAITYEGEKPGPKWRHFHTSFIRYWAKIAAVATKPDRTTPVVGKNSFRQERRATKKYIFSSDRWSRLTDPEDSKTMHMSSDIEANEEDERERHMTSRFVMCTSSLGVSQWSIITLTHSLHS